MKYRMILIFILLGLGTALLSGCYTPPGGSSIPWNEPQPGEGSFTPKVNF